MSITERDTLAKKSTDVDVISGGHLVAKALRNEGVDTIFTLCGGHIIDIYDGCLDEDGCCTTDSVHRGSLCDGQEGIRPTGVASFAQAGRGPSDAT